MSIDKRLISTGSAAAGCTTDTLDIFGDSSCVALYGLNYDGSDASGNYDGNSTDVDFNAPGHIDYAANFNGSSSYVEIEDSTSLRLLGSYSISCWVKFNNVSSGLQRIIVKDNSNDYSGGYALYANNSQVEIVHSNGSYNGFAVSGQFAVGNWYHLVVTFNSSNNNLSLYNNTTLIGSTTTSGSLTASVDNLFFGTYGETTPGGQYLNGSLDQVRIFNKALSSSEVTTLYGETSCEYTCTTDTNGFPASASSNLVAYYKLDNDATDETGSYNGTATDVTYDGGRYGSSAVFNGSSSYIDLGNNSSNNSNVISVSCWLKTTATTGCIYSNGGLDGGSVGLAIIITASGFLRFGANNTLDVTGTTAINDGNWHHVAFSYNNGNLNLYLDGNTTPEMTGTSTGFTTANRNFIIGREARTATKYFAGQIDQVRFYTKVISSTEASSLYEDEHQCYITVDSTDPFGDSSNIALYEFENNANDSTGSYNGTASNVTYSTDSIIGTYAASFNGSSSVINTSYTPTVANLRTVSLWFKTNTTTFAVMQSVGPYGGGSGYTWEWIYILADGRITGGYGANNGGAVYQKATTESFNDDNWHHLALTLNGVYGTGSSVKLYIDGVEPSTTTDTTWNTSISTIQGTFTLGALKEYSGPNFYYTGKLDQVRIFDRELNGDEVWKLYAEGAKG